MRTSLAAVVVMLFVGCDQTRDPQQPRPPVKGGSDASAVSVDAGLVADSTVSGDAGAQPADAGTQTGADSGTSATTDTGVLGNTDTGAQAPSDGGTMPPADGGVDLGPAVLNPQWIGGPCTSNADCPFADGTCLTAAQGYPGGMCTQACSRLCPDQSGPLNSVTYCVDDRVGSSDGICVSRCDNTLSPTGCRAGYVCVPEARNTESQSVRSTCLPGGDLPGRPARPIDIGAGCITDGDCAYNTCLSMPGGYCSKAECNTLGCPNGSTCYRLGLEDYHVCLKNCAAAAECRGAEGYACDADNTCWYTPPARPNCDFTGAAADCARLASQVSQDFVVVTKSMRRLALCSGSTLVQTYCVGLGSSPVLDKEREGDRRTPEGIFYMPRRIPNSSYYKAFLLSYPDSDDASRGFASGLITRSERDAINAAQAARREPPQQTNLGGLIEIHGRGSSSDWTWGCIAMDDAAIDVLWGVLQVGDNIVVEH